MDTGCQSRRVAPHQSTDGHGESVSEGSSTPVNRWMIIRDGNYHDEEPPISPAPPVFHPTHLKGYNSSKEEESPTPIPTIDKSYLSDPITALETRSDWQAPTEDVGWNGAQASSCLSVDSDSDGTSKPVLKQSCQKCFVKIKSQSERYRQSTAISTARSVDENETVTLRRTKCSTQGWDQFQRNWN